MRNLAFILGFVLGLSLGQPTLSAQTYDLSAVRQQVADHLQDAYYGHVYVVIEQGDRRLLEYQGGTLHNGNTRRPLASATKWLSGTIVLALAERGYFKLDDRIGQYLPIFDTYGKGHITIRPCFAMTSPLASSEPEYEHDGTLSLAQSVDLIAERAPLAFPTGTLLNYEGDGMQVEGRI